MKEAIVNFLLLRVQNIIEPIYWALLISWMAFVFITLQSIWGRKITASAKVFWSAVVVLLPVIGLYPYLIYSFITADYTALERFGFFKKGKES
jgi:hypothetical protein